MLLAKLLNIVCECFFIFWPRSEKSRKFFVIFVVVFFRFQSLRRSRVIIFFHLSFHHCFRAVLGWNMSNTRAGLFFLHSAFSEVPRRTNGPSASIFLIFIPCSYFLIIIFYFWRFLWTLFFFFISSFSPPLSLGGGLTFEREHLSFSLSLWVTRRPAQWCLFHPSFHHHGCWMRLYLLSVVWRSEF